MSRVALWLEARLLLSRNQLFVITSLDTNRSARLTATLADAYHAENHGEDRAKRKNRLRIHRKHLLLELPGATKHRGVLYVRQFAFHNRWDREGRLSDNTDRITVFAPYNEARRRTYRKDFAMENHRRGNAFDAHGLPIPKRFDGPFFDVRDYDTGKYAEASTLEQKIAMRGQEAFANSVTPEDFTEDRFENAEKIGIAELWAESTWMEGETQRNVDLEKRASGLKEGDMLEVKRCAAEVSEWEYAFYLPSGEPLPYTPFHDYDDQFFSQALDSCRIGEHLVCRVRNVTCFGEDNSVPVDPGFCWRVYSCKVVVYRLKWTPKLN